MAIETVEHPVITSTPIIGAQSLTTVDGAIIVTDALVTVPSKPGVTNGPSASPYVAAPTPSAQLPGQPLPTRAANWDSFWGDAPPLFKDIAWTLSQMNPWHAYG